MAKAKKLFKKSSKKSVKKSVKRPAKKSAKKPAKVLKVKSLPKKELEIYKKILLQLRGKIAGDYAPAAERLVHASVEVIDKARRRPA